MIHLSLLFWLTLALPGYAALRHFDREQLKSGLLGTLGLSYLATFALLLPISTLCYVLRLPTAVFGGACLVLIIAGAIEIIRNRWWREVGTLAVAALGVELLIVVVDLLWGARVGGLFMGDPYLHLARIRQLLDHGFSDDDPFVAGEHFFSIYHANLLHALYAACAWITRIDHLGVWHASLPFAKLLVAGGCYYLAWCIFGRQWVAWVAALFFLGLHGPMTNLIFPNRIAPFFVTPILIGLAIQFCCGSCTRRHVIAFGAGLLVLGQIHGMYAVFAVGLLGPALAVVAAFKLIRRHRDRWPQIACLAALLLALPSPLVTRLTSVASTAPSATKKPAESRFEYVKRIDRNFIQFDNGETMLHPLRGFGAHGGVAHCLLGGGVIAALCTARRRQAGLVSVVVLTGAATLYTPPVCSAVLAVIGDRWIVNRLEFILFLGLAALAPATVAYLLERKLRFRPLRAILAIGAVCAGIPFGMGGHSHTWSDYLERGRQTKAQRRAELAELRRLRAFFRTHIPPGETVLVKGLQGMQVVMLHDCHVVAPQRGSIGVRQIVQRLRHQNEMLAPTTSPKRRWELIQRYGIRYYMPREVAPWARGHFSNAWRLKGRNIWLIELTPD